MLSGLVIDTVEAVVTPELIAPAGPGGPVAEGPAPV
jgi:hypothetical protein